NFGDSKHLLAETFLLFFLILILHVIINIRGSQLVARLNGVSVVWHVVGVAVIVGVLIFVPNKHASFHTVFTERINASGFGSGMMYAFSRDGAGPGWRLWSRVDKHRIPFNAVIAVSVAALIITLPALKGNKNGVTVAFTAVVSIGVIGLYIAYAIPIWLRWR